MPEFLGVTRDGRFHLVHLNIYRTQENRNLDPRVVQRQLFSARSGLGHTDLHGLTGRLDLTGVQARRHTLTGSLSHTGAHVHTNVRGGLPPGRSLTHAHAHSRTHLCHRCGSGAASLLAARCSRVSLLPQSSAQI